MFRFWKPTRFQYFFGSAFCVEMTCAAELVVGVCLNEGPEAALNGTEDHMNSLHFVPVCNRQTQKKRRISMCMETRNDLNLKKFLKF